jgi:hypothetical protein
MWRNLETLFLIVVSNRKRCLSTHGSININGAYNLPLMDSYIIYNFSFVQTLTFDLCSSESSIVLHTSVFPRVLSPF